MSATDLRFHLPDADSTAHAGERLARICKPGDCIALSGDLGAGKTTFARGFIQALAGEVEVTSPTFTLLNTYDTSGPLLYHADLYRLRHADELAELGLEEGFHHGITLVEWPEIAAVILPRHTLRLSFIQAEEGGRALVGRLDGAWYDRMKQAGFV